MHKEQIMIRQEGITEGRIEGEKNLDDLRGKKRTLRKNCLINFRLSKFQKMLEIDISELKNIMKEIQNEKYL